MIRSFSTPYFRMALRSKNYMWWRPLSEVFYFMVSYVVMIFLFLIFAVFFNSLAGNEGLKNGILGEIDPSNTTQFTTWMVEIILLIPALYFSVRFGGKRKFNNLLSIYNKFRVLLFLRSVFLSTPLYVLGAFMELRGESFDFESLNGCVISGVFAIITLVPLQAAAEELMFRGFISQVFGAWFSCAFFPIIISTVPFVFGHDYDFIGLIDISVFSICMGVLAWVTGGLEIPIGIHAVGNIISLLLVSLGNAHISHDVPIKPVLISITLTIALTSIIIKFPKLMGVKHWGS